ncbi:MAG: hypothetical protein GXX91_03325 [Verrucomicrobiaceae bacterium]|nr:hypothetical protein [Verrucomicrobiaceae bacterium]
MASASIASGEKVKIEAGGFKTAEVAIESRKMEPGADGEGGELGVHPDWQSG